MTNFDKAILADAIERDKRSRENRIFYGTHRRLLGESQSSIDRSFASPPASTMTNATTCATWDCGSQDIVQQVRDSIRRMQESIRINPAISAIVSTEQAIDMIATKTGARHSAAVASHPGSVIDVSFLGFPLTFAKSNAEVFWEAMRQAISKNAKVLAIVLDGKSLEAKVFNGPEIRNHYEGSIDFRHAEHPTIGND